MTPTFVSFFTSRYTAHAAELVASLDAHGLPHDVRRIDADADWLRNVNRKAAFLLSMREAHPGLALVWLDADARVRAQPVLFDALTCDFAAHWRHGRELLSGTTFWAPTDAAERLLLAWRHRCEAHPDVWDQVSLQHVIGEIEGVRVDVLPASYTCVFDDPKMGPPVIEHLQASRQLRT